MYGKKLREHRENAGLSQTQLGKHTNISHQNINRWERDIISPNIEYCVILADFYGISIDELIGHDIKKNW